MLKKITGYTLVLLSTLTLFSACKKDYESIQSIDDAKIQAYIKKNGLTMTKDPSGFYYQVISNGTGGPLLNKDSVFYSLSVTSLDGVSYYNTPGYSNEGTYLGYITPEAYRTALAGSNRGAKVRVILPSYLAYGKNGNNQIPSNEVLIAEVSTRSEATQAQIDEKVITDFLAAKNLTATRHPLGVYYNVLTPGTGSTIDIGSIVTVRYAGRLLSGTVFDQTTGDSKFTYAATAGSDKSNYGAIKGWDVLLGMPVGSKVRMFIPSHLAYGPTASGAIPANSVLDFDVEIVDVQ